jgi:adenine C2-methylase RlmN of 23S rRNA A2503 and tRNA A37
LCEKKIKVLNKLFSFKKELKKKRVFYEKVKKEIVTIKILFQLKDKNFIETVLMKFNYG